MPNVPNVPGVPPLLNYSPQGTVLLAADAVTNVINAFTPLWGIYLDGFPVIASSTASLFGLGSLTAAANTLSSLTGLNSLGLNTNAFSVVDFEYKQDWVVAEYPVEQGGFESYDKVQLPFDVRMRMAAGGAVSNRSSLLESVDTIANDLNLYEVYTPETVYESCNVVHYDYARKAYNNLGLIVVDIWLKEIRVTASSVFSNTSPVAQGQVNTGTQNPTASPATVPAASSWID